MDETDRKLLLLLGVDTRVHVRELARRLGISRQAVHKRLQVLSEIGVLQSAHPGQVQASVSVNYLNAIPVAVFGRSRTESIERTIDRLGECDFTRRVVVAGGNYLYAVGVLRNISELDSYSEFVKRTAEMPEPVVGVYNRDEGLMPYSVNGGGKRKQIYTKLSPLDYRIIASLKDDARRPVTDIADMVGASAKTVRRHLENMISEGSLDLGLDVDMESGGDLMMIMHVALRNSADKEEVGRMLLSKHYFQDQYIRTFSNIPGLLVWVFWSDQMNRIRKALKETNVNEDVASVMLNLAYFERIYPTWRERLPEAEAPLAAESRARSTQRKHGARRH